MSSAYQVNPRQINGTPKQESIVGVVERLTYHSDESGYTVARLQRPQGIGIDYNYGQLHRYSTRTNTST